MPQDQQFPVPDYRAIVEAQAELISLARADGTLVYVNASYARHFGRPAGQMLGVSLYELIPEAEREAVRALAERVMGGGHIEHGENRIAPPEGEPRWMAWTNSRVPGADGGALLHSVGRDISDRKAAEAALRESRSLLERTGRAAGVGGWQLDLRTSAVTWSDQTRRIHEVADDYVPTLETAITFYAPEGRALIEAAVQRGIAHAQPWDLELPLVTAKGRRLWVRAVGEAEFEDGVAVRLVGAFQDITERRGLQERVAESERFLREIADNLPVRVAYVDRDQRYRFVNAARAQRMGRPASEIVGRTRAELAVPGSDPALEARVVQALAGQTQHVEFEERIDGRTHRFEGHMQPDLSPDGSVLGFFATAIDITERSRAERSLRELTAILESSADFVVQTDRRGEISYLNPAARRLLELPADGPLPAGLNFARFNTPETNRLFVEVIVPAVKARGAWIGDTTVLAAGGRVVPVSHLVIAHREDSGRVARYSAVMRDISEQVQSRAELLRQGATLRSVAEAIPACVAVVGADQRYRFVNGAFERWVGASRESILGRTPQQVIGGVDQERSQPWIERALAGETVSFEREYLVQNRPRHLAVDYVPLWTEDGRSDGFVAVLQDISAHREEASRLLQMSQLDPLTGLANRAGFEHALQVQLRTGGGPALALLYIDLDRFKPVNDQHGHAVGDEVLRSFAQRLRALVRPTDVAARLGGDEFAVLLCGVREQAHAETVAAKVVHAARSPFEIGALALAIGASVGVAFGAGPGATGEELLARADAMLYRAKNAGRGVHAAERT